MDFIQGFILFIISYIFLVLIPLFVTKDLSKTYAELCGFVTVVIIIYSLIY